MAAVLWRESFVCLRVVLAIEEALAAESDAGVEIGVEVVGVGESAELEAELLVILWEIEMQI